MGVCLAGPSSSIVPEEQCVDALQVFFCICWSGHHFSSLSDEYLWNDVSSLILYPFHPWVFFRTEVKKKFCVFFLLKIFFFLPMCFLLQLSFLYPSVCMLSAVFFLWSLPSLPLEQVGELLCVCCTLLQGKGGGSWSGKFSLNEGNGVWTLKKKKKRL